MVEQVLANADEIDVMRETDREAETCGNGRNFYQGHARIQDPPAKRVDVEIKRRNRGMLQRLAGGEEMLDLFE